jgi:hypothetical protein
MSKEVKVENHIHGMVLESKTKNLITLKHRLGFIQYTHDELSKELDDLAFLRDAFLVLLNEDLASKSDLPFDKETVLKYARDMYREGNWNQDLIDRFFGIK